jgi:uncharacterized protein (DUF1697 family)
VLLRQHLALLRGINVGGRNVIQMADLRASFEDHGFQDVTTYIQSGNVLFNSGSSSHSELARELEEMLARAFDYRATVVLRSRDQMLDTVSRAPRGFGSEPEKYRYDVLFLKEPLEPETAMESVRAREGVDEAHVGVGALYFARLISRASQSQLSRLASQPVYQRMTIRNWRTTTKLVQLMEKRGP